MLAVDPSVADFPLSESSFPDYVDPFTPPVSDDSCSENNDMAPQGVPLLEPVHEDEASRGPSPQPTHLNLAIHKSEIQSGTGHRTLRSSTVGYVAPAFAGKHQQKMEGTSWGLVPYHGVSIRPSIHHR
jgi:hypothetical protein